jgi:hypothetical protein
MPNAEWRVSNGECSGAGEGVRPLRNVQRATQKPVAAKRYVTENRDWQMYGVVRIAVVTEL